MQRKLFAIAAAVVCILTAVVGIRAQEPSAVTQLAATAGAGGRLLLNTIKQESVAMQSVHQAYPTAPAGTVWGACIFNVSGGEIVLKPTDPKMRYGMLAEGFDSNKDRVFVEQETEEVKMVVQGAFGDEAEMAVSNAAFKRGIPIKLKVLLANPELKKRYGTGPGVTKEWVTCEAHLN